MSKSWLWLCDWGPLQRILWTWWVEPAHLVGRRPVFRDRVQPHLLSHLSLWGYQSLLPLWRCWSTMSLWVAVLNNPRQFQHISLYTVQTHNVLANCLPTHFWMWNRLCIFMWWALALDTQECFRDCKYTCGQLNTSRLLAKCFLLTYVQRGSKRGLYHP